LNSLAQAVDRSAWQQILDLGERLAAQSTFTTQHELIVEAAALLLEGQSELWLSEVLQRLLEVEDSPSLSFPPEPPSDLMRRAIDARRTLLEERASPAVAAPLIATDAVLGVLEVRRSSASPFSDTEVGLLQGLATQSAIALQTTRQVAVERWRVEQLSLVRTVSAQVADVLGLDELARRVTQLIRETFKYYHVILFILEQDREVLSMRASAGRSSRSESPSSLEVQLGQGLVGHAAQTGAEVLANDVSRESRYRYVDALPETRSEVALPLKIGDRVLGVLDVQSDQRNGFSETDMLVLRALADNVAIAVEDARLHSGLRRRADQLSVVAEVGRVVASTLDLDTLLNRVVELIHERFGYHFVHLLTVDPARQQIVYRAGSGPRGKVLQEQGLVCGLEKPEAIVPWVACHGETALVDDWSRESRYRPSSFSEANALSELAAPIIFGGKVLGVLDVQSASQGGFGDEDQFLFEALADSVGVAIRNAHLYQSERWRRQVADSLREVAGLLSANAGLEQVLDAVLTELERNLPCNASAIWLLLEGELCLSAAHGYPDSVCIADFSPGASHWFDQALEKKQTLVRAPGSPLGPLGAALEFSPDYSAIAAPLCVGDQRLGLLTLAHHTPGRYGAESRAMVGAFASYAAVAIENARLYQEAQESARISTVMLQVAEATRSLTTLDEVLQTVVDLIPALVGVDQCALLLWDESSAAFVPAEAFGFTPEQRAAFDRWRVAAGDEQAFDDLRVSKAPVFIYDVATDDRLTGAVVWSLGFESLLLLPLLAQDEVLGVVLIDYPSDWLDPDALERLSDERLVIIQGIALQAATAIENTKLREAQRQEAYVSAALLQVARAVASLNDLDEILGTIVRIIPILVGVERCIIFLWDDEHAVFRAVQSYGILHDVETTLMAQRYAPGDFPLLDAVRAGEQRVVCSLGQGDGRFPDGFAAGFAAHPAEESPSMLALPLSVQEDVLGVMLLEEADSSRRYDDRRLEIINGVAQQAALAVQSDLLQREAAERERLERELQLAREIQQTFMPSQSPELVGWELAFTWRAARQVAGDFYDFFDLPDGRLGLVIADVADKGMPAALFMALTRTLMRAAALEETSPAAALARVNDLLTPDAQGGMFVTLFYAVLALDTGELTYANAGHNLPLLLRAGTGEVERLRKGGMVLGVLEGARSEEYTLSLEPGDCLVLYTDGITEAFSPEGDIYGEERLRATIQSVADGSAEEVLEAIDNSVDAFVGDAAPSDDRTFVVLRRL